MGFPTKQGSTATTTISGAVGPMTINLPASIAAGELLIIVIGRRASAGTGTQTFSASGWTLLASSNLEGPNTSARYTFSVLYKIASGSEGSTVSVATTLGTSQRAVALAYRISGQETTGTIIEAVGEAQAASGNPTQTMTASWGSTPTLYMGYTGRESTANAITAPGSMTFTDNLEVVASVSTGFGLSVAGHQQNGGSQTMTWTLSSIAWDANMIAIKGIAIASTPNQLFIIG